jgi:hypothetical protein
MTEKLTPEHFLPHVNKTVRVSGWHHTLTLARVDIRKLEEWEREVVQRQPFMLILRGPRGDVLPEGMHNLEIEDGALFNLYVIPVITPQPDRQNYQVVFN